MTDEDRIQRLDALQRVDERISALESARPASTRLWKNAGLVTAYGAGLAIDPDATEAGRRQVLRFLASFDGDPVGQWAAAELDRVEQKLTELEAEKQRVADDLAQTDALAREAKTEAAELLAEARVQRSTPTRGPLRPNGWPRAAAPGRGVTARPRRLVRR